MKRYVRKVTSLDQNSIDLGNLIAERLGLSFSSLVRFLINKENVVSYEVQQKEKDLKESSNA